MAKKPEKSCCQRRRSKIFVFTDLTMPRTVRPGVLSFRFNKCWFCISLHEMVPHSIGEAIAEGFRRVPKSLSGSEPDVTKRGGQDILIGGTTGQLPGGHAHVWMARRSFSGTTIWAIAIWAWLHYPDKSTSKRFLGMSTTGGGALPSSRFPPGRPGNAIIPQFVSRSLSHQAPDVHQIAPRPLRPAAVAAAVTDLRGRRDFIGRAPFIALPAGASTPSVFRPSAPRLLAW